MLYFAYGSNLNHHQMNNRCDGAKYIKKHRNTQEEKDQDCHWETGAEWQGHPWVWWGEPEELVRSTQVREDKVHTHTHTYICMYVKVLLGIL